MRASHLAWTAAALAHLALVVCGAVGLELAGRGPALGIVAQYSDVSGADTQYGFFAPGVASQCRAVMTLRDAQGREWTDELADDPGTQFGWRTGSAIDALPRTPDKLKRSLAGSWAAVLFGRHPDAALVVVDAQIEVVPTMERWREGARPEWKSLYTSTFVRKDRAR
jgi:hypothetical protein